MSNVNQGYPNNQIAGRLAQLIQQYDGKTINANGQVVAGTAADGKMSQAELAAALLSVDAQNPNDDFYTPLLAGLLFGNAQGGTLMTQSDINQDGALNEAELLHITTADADLATASQADFTNQFGTEFDVANVDEAYNSADFVDRLVTLAGNDPANGGVTPDQTGGYMAIIKMFIELITSLLGMFGGNR